MGTLVEFQHWFGFQMQGTDDSGGDIIQPEEGWLDLKEAEELVLSISVLDRWPAADVTLNIETAVVPEGPWTKAATLAGISPVRFDAKLFMTARQGTGNVMVERYVRWAVYTTDLDTAMWGACFKIDALVR